MDNQATLRLSATVHARRFSLFGLNARIPDETDAKISTPAPLENWRRPPGLRTTWMKTIQQDMKSNNSSWMRQLTWFRIIHSGY